MALYGTRLTYVYTTIEEVQRIFTVNGSDQFLEDIPVTNDYWTELLERATSRINQYLQGLYDPSDLKDSIWIREKASYIAAHFLSIRAGHPGLYHDTYEDILNDLMLAKSGELYLDLPLSSGQRPIVQNVMHDNRYLTNPIRVIPQTSSRVFSSNATSFLRPFWWW